MHGKNRAEGGAAAEYEAACAEIASMESRLRELKLRRNSLLMGYLAEIRAGEGRLPGEGRPGAGAAVRKPRS